MAFLHCYLFPPPHTHPLIGHLSSPLTLTSKMCPREAEKTLSFSLGVAWGQHDAGQGGNARMPWLSLSSAQAATQRHLDDSRPLQLPPGP